MTDDKLRAVIVEDEELPRLSLAEKLRTYHPSVEVVDICEDCDTALESILHHRPNLLFLDIELPEKNSLWLLDKLSEVSTMPMPHIIFTTAFNDPGYLMRAIRLQAVDYLLKPVSLDELSTAIRKVRERWRAADAPSAKNGGGTRKFTFKTMHSLLSIAEEEFAYCQADGPYSILYTTSGGQENVFERLGQIESCVVGGGIVRAGRKYLINTAYIYKLDTRSPVCRLKLPGGGKVDLNLSEGGFEMLLRALNPSDI